MLQRKIVGYNAAIITMLKALTAWFATLINPVSAIASVIRDP
jgi:hypothetical protein